MPPERRSFSIEMYLGSLDEFEFPMGNALAAAEGMILCTARWRRCIYPGRSTYCPEPADEANLAHKLHADKGYAYLRHRGIKARIAKQRV